MAYIAYNENGRRIGESHHRSTIPDALVARVREMRETRGNSYGEISLRLRLSINTVKKICRYERRAQVVHIVKRAGPDGKPLPRPRRNESVMDRGGLTLATLEKICRAEVAS